jgi:sugar-specific transcriptional regulator TrmB
MDIEKPLKKIGLTGSEIKVYLGLLKTGISSKGPILREAKIAPSKIYNILDKLMEKGLVSTITKNNVKNYSAAPIERLREIINFKRKELEKDEKDLNSILPILLSIQKGKNETKAEIFRGWKGMATAYSEALTHLKKDNEVLILGASKGYNPERSKDFFSKYSNLSREKGISIRMILNENSRKYISEMENELKTKFSKRFLEKTSPAEIVTTKEYTAIVILKDEPIVIAIKDKETAESFITYFNILWDIAKL